MTSPLIERLFQEHGFPEVHLDEVDGFAADAVAGVLFLTGDPVQFPETLDVAVVLPELASAFAGHLRPAVAAREDEKSFQLKYGFRRWPALVFVRDGGYLGVITGIQNWSDYLRQIAGLLEQQAKPPPGFKLPEPMTDKEH